MSARFDVPDQVREIIARLERAGHEAWCVGGAVRDALLGHAHLDWDLATSATPTAVMKIFKRTVPVGVEFGTVGVLDDQGTLHEVTTFRRDVKTDGRHAVVEFGASLEDDLARRDFTINAIAYHPKSEEIRDPFEGRLDLKRGLVRAVGDAEARMREDRLRALRAIRFASRFGFHVEPSTWEAIKHSAPHLGRLSPERVKQELEKTMEQVERPSIALEWWRETGALTTLVPLLAAVPPARFLALDLIPRGGATPEGRGATISRLAMLFFGETERDVQAVLKALRFSNADGAWMSHLAGAWAALGAEIRETGRAAEPPADAVVRRWVARVGRTRVESFFSLVAALRQAEHAALRQAKHADAALLATAGATAVDPLVRRAVQIAFRDPVELADLAVDGDDLRTVGVLPGPALGQTLQALMVWVLEDPARNVRTALLAKAKELHG